MNNSTFQLGTLSATTSISTQIMVDTAFENFIKESLKRHKSNDWGDLEEEDKESNDYALLNNERLFSAYLVPKNTQIKEEKIWIITEHDRSYTTILFPSEY